MGGKLIYFGDECRAGLQQGINKLADCVKISMGARGRLAGLGQPFGSATMSKDGVSIAREVELDDPLQNEGCKLILEALERSVRLAGDGTTLTCVLTQSLVEGALKSVNSGCNPRDLKKGIDSAVEHIIKNLKKMSTPVKGEMIKSVASISANNDEEIGQIIYEAISKIGFDGLVNMEDSSSENTYVEFSEGLQLECGLFSPYFISNPMTLESEQSNPLIMLCNAKINSFNDIVPALELCIEAGRSLFIMTSDIEQSVIAALINNNRQPNGIKSVVCLAPGFGESRAHLLEDVAAVTGATVISEDLDMKVSDVTLEMLGSAKKIIAHGEYTKIIEGGGKSSVIKDRISKIKTALKNENEEHVKKRYRTRLAKLSGGMAKIYVGGVTPSEQGEKKLRVEDSLEAVKSSIAEGVVPGGGTSLLRCAVGLDKLPYANEDERIGISIVMKAIENPIRQILGNAGLDSSLIVGKIKESKDKNLGYNVRTDQYEDFSKTGVLDPAKVIRVALIHSASVAKLLMSTECFIIKPKTNQESINTGGGLF